MARAITATIHDKKTINAKKRPSVTRWYHWRTWSALVILLSLAGAYIVASLALDSGSLLEYIAAIILIGLAVNRVGHIILVSIGKAEDGQQ
jgi:hypothetical protein